MCTETPLAGCEARARRQHGVVTRQQALDSGMTRRMIERQLRLKLWRVLFPNVYVTAGITSSWLTRLHGAVLGAGPSGIASHRAAGRLHGLSGCDGEVVEISSDRCVRWTGVKAHRIQDMPSVDVGSVKGIRTTAPTRTLLDLAGVVDLFLLEAALDSALVSGLTSVDYLTRSVEKRRRRGRNGVKAITRLLEVRLAGRAPTESELERMFERRVRSPYNLPVPAFQQKVELGGIRRRIDFAYHHALLGIEVLGWKSHQGRRAWQEDLSRHNQLSNSGWMLLYFTWHDIVERSAHVANEVRKALHLRENVLFTHEHP